MPQETNCSVVSSSKLSSTSASVPLSLQFSRFKIPSTSLQRPNSRSEKAPESQTKKAADTALLLSFWRWNWFFLFLFVPTSSINVGPKTSAWAGQSKIEPGRVFAPIYKQFLSRFIEIFFSPRACFSSGFDTCQSLGFLNTKPELEWDETESSPLMDIGIYLLGRQGHVFRNNLQF